MAVFRFTSLANFLVSLFTVVINGTVFFSALGASWSLFKLIGVKSWPSIAWIIALIACLGISLLTMVTTQIYLNEKLFHPLSAYLYARISLHTKISWKESKDICVLFVPNDTKNGIQ